MDSPALPLSEVEHALSGLSRLNRLSGAAGQLWRRILPLAEQSGPLTLLDVATGSGDIPISLALAARRRGLGMFPAACDLRPEMREIAKASAAAKHVDLRVFAFDALHEQPSERFDVVTVSLFTHHLTDGQVVTLLRSLAAVTDRLLLVSDLSRSALNLFLVSCASRIVTRSRVVHADAALSVRAAFTIPEFTALAHAANLDATGRFTIRPAWPCRFILEWRPGHE